ncbi:response regulator [Derxia lacustris]|uniref:response regulator n=1 Tax=Derxia lacustris TaxID=764842 RepID=UPI000A16D78C|nr:response regulator transcription factor [Derxia lacustris]
MHLLIIEDDIDLGPALLSALQPQGFSCVWVRRLGDALALDREPFDAVLLDLSLPDGEGLTLLRRWRARRNDVPVIVITARGGLDERLAGLDSGADDYLVKPFALPELISRLWALHRRCARQASDDWTLGDLRIAPRSHEAWLGGVALELSAREFRLLLELAREPGALVSKSLLGQRLEPLGDPVDPATIEVHLSNLRRKVGASRIRTVRGVGYQWVVHD